MSVRELVRYLFAFLAFETILLITLILIRIIL